MLQSWADAEWFLNRPALAEKITVTVFKVTGETNTDDLSPAPDAWSRPGHSAPCPGHAEERPPGITPDKDGVIGPIKAIDRARKSRASRWLTSATWSVPGSSRKSATNSVLWFMGDDIPFVPNKRAGGVCLGGKISPHLLQHHGRCRRPAHRSGRLQTGDGRCHRHLPYEGKITRHGTDEVLARFELKTEVLIDEVRAGGRIPLIIGRGLTDKAREALGLPFSTVFRRPQPVADTGKGYTLAQKMVGKACGVQGIRPGTYCEPR